MTSKSDIDNGVPLIIVTSGLYSPFPIRAYQVLVKAKEHTPPHRNKRTGQMLENREQVCPACHENFGTTEAGDSHRVGEMDNRQCLNPEKLELEVVLNQFETEVWRLKR